ncbi:MAG: mycofactocin-associated electron transfer flavoprotein alpha subunit [Acidimicrobiales bacterium]
MTAHGLDGAPVAVVPVRSSVLPVGADEAAAEAGGRCWLVGTGCAQALAALTTPILSATLVEAEHGHRIEDLMPHLAAALVARVGNGGNVIVPSSPDGRDLAPHLAVALGRPLVAGATEVAPDHAIVARHGGHTMETVALSGPVVATLQPGARSVPTQAPTEHSVPVEQVAIEIDEPPSITLLEEVAADPATMDLADARRIIAGGAGLGTPENFDQLHPIADALGASTGATRVVTDQGWISADRQIGTTGVTVDPDLYVAVGISGAVQHTAGLGTPDHVVVVNIDASCPMMELADLAIVCDGPEFVEAFGSALAGFSRTPANPGGHREEDLEA